MKESRKGREKEREKEEREGEKEKEKERMRDITHPFAKDRFAHATHPGS